MTLPSSDITTTPDPDTAPLRQAIRAECKVALTYTNAEGEMTRRLVWPLAVTMFNHVRVLVAWCALRGDFRSFRTDRMLAMFKTSDAKPAHPHARVHHLKKG